MTDPETTSGRDTSTRLRCSELVELVTPYLEGELPPAEVAWVDHHIALCPGCGAYVEQMRQTIALAGRLTPEAVPVEALDRLLAAFKAGRDTGG